MAKISYAERLKDWNYIEKAVLDYQVQFKKNVSHEDKLKGEKAAEELLDKFSPLLKKYTQILKTGQINYYDRETKNFVYLFIDEDDLRRDLKRAHPKKETMAKVAFKFNFIKEAYGAMNNNDILTNLQIILLTLAKRYKHMGKSFCAYVSSSFKYEVSRHVKNFVKNPINIYYKNIEYEDMKNGAEDNFQGFYEDRYYENSVGLPDISWILGQSCSDTFAKLSSFERKIISKYYLEELNDRQIADEFGMHINAINAKRRQAVLKIARSAGINCKYIKRNRKSGKTMLLNTNQS